MFLIDYEWTETTLEWWEKGLPLFEPYVSQIVFDEISRGDQKAAQGRLAAVNGFGVREMMPEVAALADTYFAVLDIPDKARNDSYHLALAIYHGMDYLVGWNCTHITAGRVRAIVEDVNDDKGLGTPIICTPEELMEA